jgi:tetratricopeptide (TPR) repeat protein
MTSFSRNAIWRNGISLWHDIVKKSPRDRRAYSNLCTYYSTERNFAVGFEICSKALTISSEVPDQYLINAYINRGALFSDYGDYARAIQDYRKALDLDPSNARIYNNMGNLYILQGNYGDAQNSFSRAISINPNYALAYFNRGFLHRRVGRHHEAIDDLSKVISLTPENSKAYVQRGLTYFDMKIPDKAAADFGTACRMGNSEACGFLQKISK